MKHRYFCAGSALAVAVSLGAVQAQAQTAPATPAASSGTTLSDLVVVAEKREERLETVPVAVSAFSAEQRTLVGIQGFQDLTNFTPGFHYQAASDRPYMRGIGRNTDNLAVASAVAVYYNGVYKGANATILMQHSDLFIDTVEVDRGPQNTLHGANADGGTINYISKKPTKSYYAEGRVGVGNNDRYFGEAAVSGPITDWLRFRLGANATVENGGFFKNLDGEKQGGASLPQQGAGKSQYLEAQLDGNFGDHLEGWGMISSGTFSSDYHQSTTQGAIPDSFQFNNTFAPSGFYGLCGLTGVASSPGGNAGCAAGAAAGQVVIPGSVTGGPVFANAFPGNNPSTADPRTFIQEMTSTNKLRADLALATTWTYHFPSFDVQYLGGYEKFNYLLNFSTYADAGVTSYQLAGASAPGLCAFDAAGAGYNPALCGQPLTVHPSPNTTYFGENDHFFTHELDFTSTTNSPLQWMGGLYFYHEAYDQPVWAGVEPAQSQFAHPYYIGPGGSLIVAPANPASAWSTSDTKLQYNSWAVFGHVDYKFSDAWKAHLGIRYTRDHKFGTQYWRFEEFGVISPFQSGGVPGSPVLTGFGAATPGLDVTPIAVASSLGVSYAGAGPAAIDPSTGFAYRGLNAKWNAWTGDAGVDWTPDPDTLVYAKYSRGYKAGGFSTFTLAPNPQTLAETVDAYEAGVKKTFAHTFRVNAAAFWYNYKNDQIPLNVQNAQGVIAAQLFNLPTVHIYGVELEALWQPIDDLLVTGEYSYLSAKVHDPGACFEDVVDPTASLPGANTSGCGPASATGVRTQNLTGDQLPGSPPNKFTLNGVYTLHFDPGKLALSATYIWKDKTYGTVFNRPYDLAPAFDQVNLRAVWTGNDNRYNVIAYVDNVFDKTNFDGRTGTLLSPGYIVSNSYLVNPRTFGLELRYRFQ